MKKGSLNFKFQRRKIVREKRLKPLCPDYKRSDSDNCLSAEKCKNASYYSRFKPGGVCYGGTKEEEVEFRKGIRCFK